MKSLPIPAVVLALIALSLPACDRTHADEKEGHGEDHGRLVVTTPKATDVTVTQQYVCLIHSRRHIKVCALESGYLTEIPVKEGQAVQKGDVLFQVMPTLYQARLDAEAAEAQLAQLEFNNTKKLFDDKVVSFQDVALQQAKLDKAQAKKKLAEAELNFATVRAPFDGIIDRLEEQTGSLVKEGEVLTTLSDNGVMWVYFNVPEARYLEYMTDQSPDKGTQPIELELANGRKFRHTGKIGAIEAKFNHETGNIPFRADFPNPEGLLRHGQTGKVLIHRVLAGATVIPQRATFEILDRRYVYVVDDQNVVHQREVVVDHELEDIFVLKSGLKTDERFVLEGVRQVRDGQKVECEFRKPEEALANQKNHAE
ncbi:MAG TPA: efflux RND transporter periplasmic adaptor subunit [Gemmataceae bacterium]|jgi:membrane fusion protein (multidrug efflux system)|nr:efflux RND transporter periplasmic adaptor subunit [Gemmataceae bacterium]